MLIEPLRLVAELHGHVGYLAAAALVHPAIVLRGERAKAHGAVAAAVILTSVTFGIGTWLYGDYRLRLKRVLFQDAPTLGWLFERKEHLAFAVMALAWAGAFTYIASLSTGFSVLRDDAHIRATSKASTDVRVDVRKALQRATRIAFVSAACGAFAVAIMGTVVAAFKTF